MELDETLCYCFHITQRKVLNYIRVHRLKRASQIAECGGAGTGCGWCIPYLKRCFEQQSGKSVAAEITASDYAQQRAEYIRAGKGKPAAGAVPLPAEDPPHGSDSSGK